MFNTKLTEAEINQINYNDNAVKNAKSDKQLLAIEIKERNKVLEARKRKVIPNTKRVTMCYGKFYDMEKDIKIIEKLSEEYIDSI